MHSTTVRLLLFVVLALRVADAPAQPDPGGTPAPAAEPSRPAGEFGIDVPRGAMGRFTRACRDGQYARAAEYLNLKQLRSADRARKGPELAHQLETVLDRALWVDLDRLSDRQEGYPDDGLTPLRDSLGTIKTAAGPVEVFIERVPQAGGPPVWKVAATTVAVIPELYEEFGWGPLARVLPAPFFELRFLYIRLWQWIGLVLLVGAAWLGSRLGRRLAAHVAQRSGARRPEVERLVRHTAGPLRLVLAVAVFAAGLRFLALTVPVQRVATGVETAVAIAALAWLVLRWLDVVSARVEQRLEGFRHARAAGTVPLGRRSLKVFVALVAIIAALQNFGFNVTGLIAGLGIGGLAVALAAQKTVENLFGSVSLVADQPVRVGDVCRFGDTVGRVEDIGLRSTRLRTLDHTLVTIPNAHFSTLALENLSRRDRIPVRARLSLPQPTSAEQVREVLVALRQMLAAEPTVDAASARVRFVRLEAKALEIELFAYVRTAKWDEFVEIREQIFLRTLEVVGPGGAALS